MKKLLFVLIFIQFHLFSQELDATVTVNYEKLPIQNQEFLVTFKDIITEYLNSNRFSGENWNVPKIKCTFNIYFQSASDETNYSAQVFIGSQRDIYKSDRKSPMLTILDNNWSFTYEKNQPLNFLPSEFNPIQSFFDYYANVIIGMESDSWEKLSGKPFFDKALFIVNLALSSRYAKGWDRGSGNFNRRDFVEDLLNEKYRTVRESLYDYHYGLDFQFKNKIAGQEKIAGFVFTMNSIKSKIDSRSVFVKTLFDAKHSEIIENLKEHPKREELFKILRSIDPPHSGKYDLN